MAVIVALGIASGAARAESGATMHLTPAALRDLAFATLQSGDAEQALVLTEALLMRDPRDAGALIIRSQALRALGRLAEAEAAARSGFAAADTLPLKYGAALALAQALSLEGHRTRAQIWLRRATHYATTDDQRRRVASDYGYVRQQNPLNLRFDTSLQPSNNVNNGSMHSIWEFMGLPFELSGDARALSGLVGDFGIQGSYRLAQSLTTHDALTFGLSDHEVYLAPEAHRQAPGVSNDNYRMLSLQGGYQHRDLLAPDGTILTTELSAERTYYGSAGRTSGPSCTDPSIPDCIGIFGPLSDTATLSLDLSRPYAPGSTNFAHLDLQRNWRRDDPASSSILFGGSGGFSQRLASGDQLQGSFGLSRVTSDNITVGHTTASVTVGYTLARPIAGIRWSGSLGASLASYGYSYVGMTSDRADRNLTLGLSGELNMISIYGFSPVLSLSVSANESNADLYDTRSFGLGLSFRSQF